MKKKGFTLIELLAVVVVLAIVAVVSVPIVLDVIDDVRNEANRQTIYGLMDGAKLYYADSMLDKDKKDNVENVRNIYNLIEVDGEKPASGQLYVNEDGKVSLSVTINKKCYIKDFNSELQEYDIGNEICNKHVGEDNESPEINFVIDGSKGNEEWYISQVYITINVTDESSGVDYYNWCTGEDCTPINKETSNKTVIINNSTTTQICVQAYDNAGNVSEKCTDDLKLDKDAPTAGKIEINGTTYEPEEITNKWFNEDLTIKAVDGSDLESGHLSTTVDITSITESTTEEGKVVIVTTTDVAGNISTKEYVIKLDKTQPEVTITKDSDSTKLTATVIPTSAPSVYSYQWYKDGSSISGATSSTYTPTTAGVYTVKVTTGAGLVGTSNEITISSYTIKYDMNGGTGSIADQTKVQDIPLTLSEVKPEREGYTFQGWSTSKTATEKEYSSGSTYTANVSTTLYAVWKANTFTCASGYYLGESSTSCTKCEVGSYCAGGTYNYSTSVQGKEICPTGYPTSSAGSDEASDCYKTLTATFVGNGATLTGNTQPTCNINYNKTSCEVTAPTISREGYIIVGFNESSLGTTSQVNSGAEVELSSDKTYFAITKEVVLTLTETSGTTYVGGSNLTTKLNTEVSKNYGTLTCKSSNESVATCSVSGTTLTMTPGATAGSAVITVTEGNVGITAKYTFNNLSESFAINAAFTASDAKYYANDSIRYWLNKDYYVKVAVTSEETITKIEMCTATTNTCNPTGKSSVTGTSGSMLIAQESNNNRVCVQAYDSLGRVSGTVCSEAYGKDTAAPTAGTITVTPSGGSATTPTTNWYNKTLTIQSVNGNDALSGHLSTTVDTTSITSSTTSSGKVVTVTTSDKAGNIATRTYTLKVDITQLEVTITKESGTTKLTATVSPTSAPSVYSYQWYKDGSSISGATSSTYTPTTAGVYTLKVTTGAGLSDTSNSVTISSYTISYDMNGGTGSISSQTKVQDILLTLSGTTPTRTGYTFQGWATSKTATDKEYSSGGTYTANAGATLYAVWKVNSYTCAAGYYLGTNATSCTKCEAGSYCAGGTYNYSATTQGKSSCPSGYGSSAAGSNEASDCYIQTTAGKYIATANTSTQSTCTAGYYCPSTKVYYGNTGTRTQCTVGNYCPSGAGSQTACPSGYTSVAGSDAQSDCYIQTTVGKYVATANSSSQTACTAGYYCLSTKIYYGKTGGRTACPSSHSSSAASSDAQSDCYKTITITYSGNGSTSGSTSNSSCKAYYNNSSCNITLRANGFTKTGYSFKGWGTGTSSVTHNASQQYSFSANDTLYAIWEAAKTISCSNYYYFLDSAGINANYCTSSKDYVMVGNSTATCLSNAYSDVNDLSNTCSQCMSECSAAGYGDCGSRCCVGAPSLEELFASTYNSCCDTNGCDTEGTPVLSLVSTSGSMKSGGNTLSTSIRGTGTFTCKSSNTSVATCSISNSTLKITSGSTAGTATITVTSSYGLTTTYTVTVISGPTHEECDAEAVAYGNQCGQDCASACSGCQNPNGCNCDCQSAYNSCYSQKYNECMGN